MFKMDEIFIKQKEIVLLELKLRILMKEIYFLKKYYCQNEYLETIIENELAEKEYIKIN